MVQLKLWFMTFSLSNGDSLQIGPCQADVSTISASAIPATVAALQATFQCDCWHWHNYCNSLNDSKTKLCLFRKRTTTNAHIHTDSGKNTHTHTRHVLMRFTVCKTTDNFRQSGKLNILAFNQHTHTHTRNRLWVS